MISLSNAADPPVALEDVIINAELERRPRRAPDHERVNRALVGLAQELTHSPKELLQKLVDAAIELCRAHSAGLTMVEEDGGQPILRWHATAGELAPRRWETMSRTLSPCGTVLDRDTALLMLYPQRHFLHLTEVTPRMVEVLMIPFHASGQPVGTIWVIAHDESRKFDAEDLRVMTQLGEFSAAAYKALSGIDALGAARAELETANRALKNADRRKDEFLATLAHELRNPLAPILSAVHCLKRKSSPDSEQQHWGDLIERQVSQMARLIDDLLDVARITRDKVELRRERVELAAVVQSAAETSRPLIEQMGHELTIALPREPVVLDADPTRLSQVFSNLLNNAAKYTHSGGHIHIRAERRGSEVVVTVEDDGIGISAEQLPRLFEMFSQVSSALEWSQGGLGVGLSLVKRLVEMHGGSIQAHSDGPGKGSALVLRLPVPAAAPPEPLPERPPAAPTTPAKHRILLVDDNKDAVEALGMLLEMMGHETHAAYDGAEAIAAARSFRPDVALLDIGLPGMNGYEACRQIRTEPWGKRMVLVAVTGWGQETDKNDARRAGFNAHMTKPLELPRLQKLLDALPSSDVSKAWQ